MITENPTHMAGPRNQYRGSVIIGKDVLELLSSAMYVDPLTIYREYIQNAADAIDQAETSGYYSDGMVPSIDIILNHAERSAKICDNGIGIAASAFATILTSIGASRKRGTTARGFRGVGRLAGLGYCQELIMRSRGKGESIVSVMRWDCRKLKELLRDRNDNGLENIISEIVSVDTEPAKNSLSHFFEIELLNLGRYRNDLLLNEVTVANYLGQTGPLPFAPSFKFGFQIDQHLKSFGVGKNYKLTVNKNPVHRLFADTFEVRKNIESKFTELQFIETKGQSNEIEAAGWILHSEYMGAIPERFGISGLRLRAGNIQIGGPRLLDQIFPESRFNGWVVGEIHALSPRLTPNGRRDDFELNNHYSTLLNHLNPVGKSLYKRCRVASAARTDGGDTAVQVADAQVTINFSGIRRFLLANAERKVPVGRGKKLKKLLRKSPTYSDVTSVLYQESKK